MTTDDLLRVLLVVLAALLVLPILMTLFMFPLMGAGWGHMWNDGMWSGTTTPWVVVGLWALLIAVLLGGLYLLFATIGRSREAEMDPAIEELRLAYARGELSDEEFEERRDRLECAGGS